VDPTNPQSWNRYAYVLNNPLIAIDPLGLDCIYLNDDNSVSEVISGDCFSPTDNGYYVNESGVDPNSISFSADGSELYYAWSNPQNPDDAGTGVLGTGPSAVQTSDSSDNSSLSWALNFGKSLVGGFSVSTKPGTCLSKFVDTTTAPLKQVRSAVQYYIPIAVSALQSAPTLTTAFGSYMRMAGSFSSTPPSETAQDIAALYTVSAMASQAVPLLKTATPYGIATAADGVLFKGLAQEVKAGKNGQCTW
jgi:hypothetical protein